VLGVWSLVLLATMNLLAQSYSIDWFTMDGGGGVSSGGSYTLSGTIGQPDAGTLSGGNYTLEGGFWPGIVLPSSTSVAPTLSIQLSGNNVIVSWAVAFDRLCIAANRQPGNTSLEQCCPDAGR